MFDKRLIDLRLERGLSKKEVSEMLGLPYTTYSNYENDEREPNSETLIKISSFFDVSIDFLLGLSRIRKKENEMLCEALGLSEISIEHLKEMSKCNYKDGNGTEHSLMESLDYLLADESYNEFISTLANFYMTMRYNQYKGPTPKEVGDIISANINILRKHHFEIIGTYDLANMHFEWVMGYIRHIYTDKLLDECGLK